MNSFPLIVGFVGFGLAFLSFAGVLVLVLGSHPGTRQAYSLIVALLVSLFWAGAMCYGLWTYRSALVWFPVVDVLHVSAWLVLTAAILGQDGSGQSARRIAFAVLVLGSICCVAVIALSIGRATNSIQLGGQIELLAFLILALLGLLALEQVMRNTEFSGRHVVRPISIGIGLIFVLEIFCYSQALIFSSVNAWIWQLRGFGNAFAAPFILIAIKRQRDWEKELFVSRHVVFHTATLLSAGAYLLALGLAGAMIGPFDATPRAILEVAFLVAAGAVFLFALFSTTVHRRFKVFIAKHFYRNRYDYRQEWLRLIETLAGTQAEASISDRAVKALADIIESPGGELWWADEPGMPYQRSASWGTSSANSSKQPNPGLVRFLEESRWVVDTEEYRQNPERYENAFENDRTVLEPPSIVVPLVLEDRLRGIVRLDRRSDLGRLEFEDHDLLKTAGKQVAVFFAQERIQAKLAETKQFEAFSRLTTFLMHDLKNMISQQELVVGNARKFKHKPEFVDDAIRTIEASVKRMRSVLERLQTQGSDDRASTINVGNLVKEIAAACGDREPGPRVGNVPEGAVVAMNREKLKMALTHAVRNAQDATPPDGSVVLSVALDGSSLMIDVVDTGAGMTPEFIRERLFSPFDSTKGAQGMGIGAYQIRETLWGAGGDVDVESKPGAGTRFRFRLPLRASSTGDIPAQ